MVDGQVVRRLADLGRPGPIQFDGAVSPKYKAPKIGSIQGNKQQRQRQQQQRRSPPKPTAPGYKYCTGHSYHTRRMAKT